MDGSYVTLITITIFFRHYELVDFGKDFRKEVFLLQRFYVKLKWGVYKTFWSGKNRDIFREMKVNEIKQLKLFYKTFHTTPQAIGLAMFKKQLSIG